MLMYIYSQGSSSRDLSHHYEILKSICLVSLIITVTQINACLSQASYEFDMEAEDSRTNN